MREVIQPWLDRSPKYKLDVSPLTLVFEPSAINKVSLPQRVTIVNKGYAPLQIEKLPSHRDFIFSPVGDTSVLQQGETLMVDVFYRPATITVDTEASLKLLFGCGVPLKVSVPLSVIA